MAADLLILGWVLSKFLGPSDGAPRRARPPAPQPPSPEPSTPAAPSPIASPAAPPPAPPPAPPFPVEVPVPSATAPTVSPGMKKAIEVWQVRPEIAAAGTVLVGVAQAQSVPMLEQSFPKGWQPATVVSRAEMDQAVALLKHWRKGGLVFSGPPTLTGRRAFRMTEHPKAAPPPVPAPVAPSAPSSPPATVPASVTNLPPAPPPPPAVAPVPAPVTLPPVPSAEAPQRPPGLREITTVRRGEGLANIARRLGRPPAADGQSIRELQEENVPSGPDNVQWSKAPVTQGALKKAGRRAGLNPGDRLFVPPSWGTHDPASL